MLLDIWVIFAAGLVLLLALAGTGLIAWRARTGGKARAELEARCEAARVALEQGKALLDARAALRDWKQELTSRLEALDAEAASTSELSPAVAVRRLVLRGELTGQAVDLTAHLSQPGGNHSDGAAELDALRIAHAALEAEFAALRATQSTGTIESSDGVPVNLSRERELKALVQQFTRDSREMLTCIQSLESENQTLRSSLGGKAKSAV